MRRLLLVRHAPTRATQRGAFAGDEPLTADGAAAASALAAHLPPDAAPVSSPARRCRQTAAAAGLDPALDARLTECDFGRWAGRTMAEVHAAEPDALARWMGDTDAAPHGGESLAAFAQRVGAWLQEWADAGDGTTVAVTHGGVVAAVVIRALGAPMAALWRVSAGPLTVTELHGHDGHWTLHGLGVPVGTAR